MRDVICFGSAIIDAFVDISKSKTKKGNLCLPLGSKLLANNITFEVGGGGTNSAVSLARLGLRTSFIGKIGKGHNSERIIKLLRRERVNTSLIIRKECRTGFSTILDIKNKDRVILTFRGSNDNISYDDIKKSKLRTRWFYFSSMVGKSLICLKKLSIHAREHGKYVLFNPSSYLAKQGASSLKPILDSTSILVMNKEEAALLVGKSSITNNLRKLYSLCHGIVIITDGKKGVYAYDGEESFAVKPRRIKPVETTGAGDAFASTFLGALIKTSDIEFALKAGVTNSESVIRNIGAKKGLLHWRELVEKVNTRHVKVTKKPLTSFL